MQRAFALLASAAAIGLLAIACADASSRGPASEAAASSDRASTDASDAGDDASAQIVEPACPAMPSGFGSASCVGCMASTCCDVITECTASSPCDELLRCVLACLRKPEATACRASCITSHPAGEDGYLTVDDCWAALAPDGCAIACSE